MNSDEPLLREELLASLVCQYDESLRTGAGDDTLDKSPLAVDEELAGRFDAAKAGLEALQRVRHIWDPRAVRSALGEDETVAGSIETNQSAEKTIGRFRIQWELGRGGLGVVFLAHDPKLHRNVALKVPRLESLVSDEIRERFMREAAAAARLNHQNLVGVYEVGEEAGIWYIASEYCAGITLRRWINDCSTAVPATVAATIVRHLAQAVQHAHGRGVLHRDIKPSNVLVVREQSDLSDSSAESDAESSLVPVVKLADFGMAKLLEHDGDQTRSGAILGTLAYMAPEQAEGRTGDIDVRTDVYGLGAVLYELLTGRPPAQGDTDADTLRQLLFSEVKYPSRLRRDVPRDLEAICLKCLAKAPRHRYNTAQELSDDLARFLEGRATEARPLSFPETAWKWVRRRPGVALIAALLLISASALMGTVIVYNARLQTTAELATRSRIKAQEEAESRRRLLYSTDVRLAYETLNANNVVQAIEVLDRQIPLPGESDLREFAWHYLRRLCDPDTTILTGHEGTAFSVAVSPKGDLLASAGQDGTARLWNSTSGAQLHVLRGHTTEVTSVAFSPDGETVASGSEDRTVRIWNSATGEPIRVLKGHQDHVQAVAYSPDGLLLCSGSRDTTVRIWDAASGEVRTTLDDGMDVLRAVAFSPAGDKLFAVDEAECLHAWETATWNRTAREKTDGDKLFALAVSHDGHMVAAAGRHRNIYVWQVEGNRLRRMTTLAGGHTEWIQSLAFSPVDDTIASAGKDGVIRVWRPEIPVPVRTLLGHKSRIWSVAWSPDGKRLASSGGSAAVRLWDLKQSLCTHYPRLATPINSMDLAPDGGELLAGTWDGSIQLWDPFKRAPIKVVNTHATRIGRLRISPDGSLIASSSKNESCKVWSRWPFEEINRFAIGNVASLSWDPTGDRLAICPDDTTAAIVDVKSGKILHRFKHEAGLREVLFTPDGSLLVTTGLTFLDIWDINTERRVFTIHDGHSSVAVTNDGSAIAAVDGSNVSLIDRTAGFRHSTLVTSGVNTTCVAFAPDGNTLAVGLRSPSAISFWDRRTGHELMRLHCDAAYITDIVFSPDCRKLFVGGKTADEEGGIWEWAIGEKNLPQRATTVD